MRFALLILMLAASIACAAPPTSTPTAPATTQPLVLHKAQAVELDTLTRDGAEASMWYQLRPHSADRILFGQMDTLSDDDEVLTTAPIIAWYTNEQWTAIKITDPRLRDAAWVYVAAGPAKGEIWGILDQNLDAHQKDVVLVHSLDAGATFELTSIRKPQTTANFDSFCIDSKGHGRLSVYLDAGGEKKNRPGFYHFRTIDAGRTWSPGEYEADATSPADDVPDAQQPIESAKPVQKV